MTNTPMTFEEWLSQHGLELNGINDGQCISIAVQLAKDAYEASQAQQAQTIAELVEALDRNRLYWRKSPYANLALDALAKVKGK